MPIESLSDVTKGGTSAFAGGGSGLPANNLIGTASWVINWGGSGAIAAGNMRAVGDTNLPAAITMTFADTALGGANARGILNVLKAGDVIVCQPVNNGDWMTRFVITTAPGNISLNRTVFQVTNIGSSGFGTGPAAAETVYFTFQYAPPLSDTSPIVDGTAAAGTAVRASRGDHVHPKDTSKQDVLVSGTNIKTINSQSVLGAGNLAVGDVEGPASSVANYVPQWSNTTGKLLKAGLPVQTSTVDVTAGALLTMGAFGLPTVANYLALPKPGSVNGTTDFNAVTNAGYYYRILGNAAGSRNTNHPDGQTAVTADSGVCDYYYVYNFLYDNGLGNSTQIAVPYLYAADTAKATIKMRHFYGGSTWTPWKSVGGGGGSDPSKQDVLVSGTNIKTINSQSVLGAGGLAVGDVVGPASSVTGQLARFASTSGKLLDAGPKLTVGTTAPSSPAVGDLWVDMN